MPTVPVVLPMAANSLQVCMLLLTPEASEHTRFCLSTFRACTHLVTVVRMHSTECTTLSADADSQQSSTFITTSGDASPTPTYEGTFSGFVVPKLDGAESHLHVAATASNSSNLAEDTTRLLHEVHRSDAALAEQVRCLLTPC